MQRLGRNHDGYHGERIDIAAVLAELVSLAQTTGWTLEEIPVDSGAPLLALQRKTAGAKRAVYLSAGIHGDEPAGPLAALELMRASRWPAETDLWLCPCLNPAGMALNTRGNADGVDLNRDYRHGATSEVRAHITWLRRQPRFDLTLCLHEDWEAQGFYVYELRAADRPPLAPRVVAAVANEGPIDHATAIDGRPAQGGMIFPDTDIDARPLWPEALYLFRHHTAQTLTLEAASDFPLALRVAALVAGVRAAWGAGGVETPVPRATSPRFPDPA